MKRKVVSLDGTWSVVFDEKNSGKRRGFAKKLPRGKPIEVPGVWEQVRPLYDGVGWYKRTFDVPQAWLGETVRLRFGAVNYFCEVYVNGTKVGEHEGGYTPFEFDVTRRLVAGANSLVVRVIDPPRRKVIEGFRSGAPLTNADIPTWKAGWYWNFGGIWQSVSLIVTPRVYVEDVFVEPLPDERTAKVHVTVVAAKAARAALSVDVAPWKAGEATGGKAARTVSLKRGRRTVTLPVKIEKMRLWDLDDPFLYVASVSLATDAGKDVIKTRFGMRTFTVVDRHYHLNGRRILLKGFLHQGAYPETLAFAPTKALLKKEVALVKKNGFNFIRLHLKPDAAIPELADEMGLLLCGEPPAGWVRNTPNILRRCVNEVDGLIRRDRNHPSIVMWCMLNETYHYWTFNNRERDRLRKTMSRTARELDPTRIIGDNSGGCHESGVCLGAMMPYEKTYSPMWDLHHYCEYPTRPEILETRYRNLKKGPGPIYISEFGAFECPPDWDKTMARYGTGRKAVRADDYIQYKSFVDSFKERFRQAGLKDTFRGVGDFIRRNDEMFCEEIRAIVSAMRSNPRIDAYAICQLADASGEIFGTTDIWRQPKRHFAHFAAASQTPWIIPHLRVRVIEPGQDVPLVLDCANEHLTGRKYKAVVTVRPDGGGRALHRIEKTFTSRDWVQNVLEARLSGPRKGGRYVVEAVLREGGKVRATNSLRLTVVEQPVLAHPLVEAAGLDEELGNALRAAGAEPRRMTNSTCWKDNPFVMVGRAVGRGGPSFEGIRQMSRQVRLGGTAVVLEPSTPVLHDSLLPSVIRLMQPMRTIGYARRHPILEGLPTGIMEYEYSGLKPGVHNTAEDVQTAGGTTIMGGIGAHMWTQPDIYLWTGLVDEVPVGRGRVILVQLRLLSEARRNPTARRLLRNILAYAAASIKPGLDDRCVGRCIDPITKP